MRDISVLIADDEAFVRQFLETVIKKENLPVATLYQAENGLDTVTLGLEHAPDLIFLDIRMPGQDGLKAAKALINGGYRGKIVIVSAYSEFDYAREAFRIGVSDYLLKPVKPESFSSFILHEAQTETYTQIEPSSAPKPRPGLVSAVLAYISENLGSRLRVEDIAKAVHLSPWHLSRTFKRMDGRSIMDCVRELRIERAKELLTASDVSVTEISVTVGFENAGYFATCFKQATAMSPSEYRKAHDG